MADHRGWTMSAAVKIEAIPARQWPAHRARRTREAGSWRTEAWWGDGRHRAVCPPFPVSLYPLWKPEDGTMGVFQLSRKGRLLISRQMRKRLGLKPGGRIQVTEARDTFS
jgi:hypothetical protein